MSPNAKKAKNGIDDPVLERNFCKLLTNYLKGDAIIDILANIPGVVYTIILGEKAAYGVSYHDLFEDRIFLSLMALKFLRLFHLDEVQETFTKVFDKLGEIFYL